MGGITRQSLSGQAFAPFGWVLGDPSTEEAARVSFHSASSDFWRAHLFEADPNGYAEILWVVYRDRSRQIDRLEAHWMTQQVLIPLTGDVVQVVAASTPEGRPDLGTLSAFHVPQGRGICMRPGCWHATRVLSSEVQCVMLTRKSTTLDLIGCISRGDHAVESSILPIPGAMWSD